MREAIIDIPQADLAPSIFVTDGAKPKLQPAVRKHILTLASQYAQWGRISDVLLIGSILTKQYDAETDLDVTIVMIPFSEQAYMEARQYAGSTWDTDYIQDTAHPINYFVREDWQEDLADHIYNVLNDEWIKQTEVTPVDIDDYYKSFQDYVQQIDISKGELTRDLVDYDILRKFDLDAISSLKGQLTQKIDEIDVDVKEIVATYKTIRALRRLSFRKDLTPDDIIKYQIRNKLPANVVYKLLERYHYLQLLGAVTKALEKADGDIESPEDVDIVKQALRGGVTPESLILQSVIAELTGSGAAGSYDVPLGARPQGRKKRRKRKSIGVKEYV